MGRIRVLSDHVANQIAAGEVVERPASVVKELVENSLDAGATHIRIDIEAGGRSLVRVTDNGCGMVRDDALLAFERHATSKIRSSDDLLTIATLGFRGEALPSIASVARVDLRTRYAGEDTGTEIEIAGGKILRVEDTGAPPGTMLCVRDLFYATPARRKFLKSEQTELQHVAQLATHYSLLHHDLHFELHTATHCLLNAPPVADASERVYQVFGKETLDQLVPVAAELDLLRSSVPEPPPWKRGEDYQPPEPGLLRLRGFTSKPALQKLNRNSMYLFVNGRLVRDRLLQHALTEAYRNIIPPTSYPVVLLFFDLPAAEVDVNVHPAKSEVRFRQSSVTHDFVRDAVRNALMRARPAASFLGALEQNPLHSPSLSQGVAVAAPQTSAPVSAEAEAFALTEKPLPPMEVALPFLPGEAETFSAGAREPGPATTFGNAGADAEARNGLAAGQATGNGSASGAHAQLRGVPHDCALPETPEDAGGPADLSSLASLRALGQLRDSFILAVNHQGLWIIDQHVAHERVLFEKILNQRDVESVQRQRLLMPLLVELQPAQMLVFAEIAAELERNGFEAEPFGARTIAIKAAPAGLEGDRLERMLQEVLEGSPLDQRENLDTMRTRIAASIACHAAIKVNMRLEPEKMDWLLAELAKTEHPTSCPHGRPIALRYSMKEIQKAFSRI